MEKTIHRRVEVLRWDDTTEEIEIADCFDMARVLHDSTIVSWQIIWDSNPRVEPRKTVFPGKFDEIQAQRQAQVKAERRRRRVVILEFEDSEDAPSDDALSHAIYLGLVQHGHDTKEIRIVDQE